MITIGERVTNPATDWEPQVICEDRELAWHLSKPWGRAYVARQVGLPLAEGGGDTRAVTINPEVFARHCALFGSTGSGKSRLLIKLAEELIVCPQSPLGAESEGAR